MTHATERGPLVLDRPKAIMLVFLYHIRDMETLHIIDLTALHRAMEELFDILIERGFDTSNVSNGRVLPILMETVRACEDDNIIVSGGGGRLNLEYGFCKKTRRAVKEPLSDEDIDFIRDACPAAFKVYESALH